MFIGHFGLGFGAKKAAPAVSLGTLFIASQFADLLWPTLVLLGIERVEIQPGATAMTPLDFVSYPWSHSLEALCLWGVVFGGAYVAVRRARISAAVTLALLVVSHWVLDYVTHRPDMPLTVSGATRVGLGLWFSVPGTLIVEFLVFGGGLAFYVRTTAARDRIGSIGRRVVGAGDVAARRLGILGGQSPDAEAELASSRGLGAGSWLRGVPFKEREWERKIRGSMRISTRPASSRSRFSRGCGTRCTPHVLTWKRR